MYSFYDKIKLEKDLMDLTEYLKNPLSHINLLELKLQSLIGEKSSNTVLVNLLAECKKITDVLLPDLIGNYCELSLEFRNKVVIKEYKNSTGENIKLTSKDLLLKNCAKIIEHITLLEEQFYKEFSFDFLVNSRIISELGYQTEFLDTTREQIKLENKYTYTQKDNDDSVIEELERNNPALLVEKNGAKTALALAPMPLEKIIEDNDDGLDFSKTKEVKVITETEEKWGPAENLVLGVFILCLFFIMIFTVNHFKSVSSNSSEQMEPNYTQSVSQQEEIRKMNENTDMFFKKLKEQEIEDQNEERSELIKMTQNTQQFIKKLPKSDQNSPEMIKKRNDLRVMNLKIQSDKISEEIKERNNISAPLP